MIDPSLLHAFADEELSSAERAEVEAKLKTCLDSQQEFATIQALKHALATHEVDHDHAVVWSVCRDRLNEIDRNRRTEGFVARYSWVMAAGVFSLIVVTGLANRGTTTNSVEGADLAQIMSQIGTGSGRRANPQEQRLAAELLRQARLVIDDEALRVTEMQEFSYNRMMVRRVTLRDGRGAIALLDLPNTVRIEGLEPLEGTIMQAGRLNTMNCVAWPSGGRTLVLVGPREHDALARVGALVHEAR